MTLGGLKSIRDNLERYGCDVFMEGRITKTIPRMPRQKSQKSLQKFRMFDH